MTGDELRTQHLSQPACWFRGRGWRNLLLIASALACLGTGTLRLYARPPQQAVADTSHPSLPPCSAQTAAEYQNNVGIQSGGRYRLQHDDVISLNFPLAPELNQTPVVQPDGYISLISASPVNVALLTLPEAKDAILKAYGGVLHDPLVSVDLKDYQKPSFTVLGQVTHAGRYDLRFNTTLVEGLALGGGLVPTARTQVFLFRRIACNEVEVHAFNLKEVLRGKNVNQTPVLMPGDVVFVPEKFIVQFRKYLPYGVGLSFTPSASFF